MAATTTLNLSSTLALASYSTDYALAQAGDGVVVAAFPWLGQYFSGSFELSQVCAAFDTGALTGSFVSANLILTVDESYGNTTVEVRQHDWPADITAWTPGADLASKPLLGSVTVAPGGKRDITIPLSAFALTAPLKVVLSIADQRLNVTPTGDTTLLVSNARLAVTTATSPEVITTTGAGSWTVPAGVTSITVEAWGGGGGGEVENHAGGGGGGYSASTLAVTPGQSIGYSVGAGGVGLRVTPYRPNTPGADTWFSSTSILLAKGGNYRAGTVGAGGWAGAGVGTTRYSGGDGVRWAGGVGSFGPGAGGGGSAHPLGNGGNATAGTSGAAGMSGASGTRAGVVNAAGVTHVEGGSGGFGSLGHGGAPGGGGGSNGTTSSAGGDGGRGQIRITFTADATPPVDTTPPTITSATSVSMAENTTSPTGTLTANEVVTWSKNGGADAALFSLSGATWTLNATPDFEVKTSYVVIWRAVDAAGNGTNQTFTVNITDVNETPVDTTPPTITSSANPSAAENVPTPSGTLTANEAVTWTKFGGADQALFSLSGSTWTLNATPDFETKSTYVVIWRATDTAGNTTNQTMTLGITDVDEGGPPVSVEDTITAPGTSSLVVPAGVTSMTFKGHGGGGGGAGRYNDPIQNVNGGGGGGAAAGQKVVAVSPGQTLTFVVGAGGAGGPNQVFGAGGFAGGDTTVAVNGTVVFRIKGGSGAPWTAPGSADINNTTQGGAGGQASACLADSAYSGGVGNGAGQYGNGGAGGGAATLLGNGSGGSYYDGGAAGPGGALKQVNPDYWTAPTNPDNAAGGAGSVPFGTNGSGVQTRAGSPGGGGGGCGNGPSGGPGGRGQLIISYTSASPVPVARLKRSFFWL